MMKNVTELFRSEERKGRAAAAAFFRTLADKIATGNVGLKKGAEDVELTIPSEVVLEVKARRKAKGGKVNRHRLEVELKWKDSDHSDDSVEVS